MTDYELTKAEIGLKIVNALNKITKEFKVNKLFINSEKS